MKAFIKKFIPQSWINSYHKLWPLFGALLYRFPGRSMQIIGVTGTNGKTTVVHLLSEILIHAGFTVAYASSLRFKIGSREWINDLKMTMPGRTRLQEFLASAKKAGCTHVVLEVTSEGIKQHRHAYIPFTGAIITNVTKEHLEAHGGFEAYKAEKLKLFKVVEKNTTKNKFIVVNLDDPSSDEFLNFAITNKYGYTTKQTHIKKNVLIKILCASNIKTNSEGTTLNVGSVSIASRLMGTFNVSNILASLCGAEALGVPRNIAAQAITKFSGTPGRLEFITRSPFNVVVDYAHTPDALEKVYSALTKKNKELICVIGSAGGGRDKWKRKEMGAIAAKFCKHIIVTNEDPYDENPVSIIDEVAEGVQNAKGNPQKIIDRKEAIKTALSLGHKNSTVIITGKGAEPWMVIAGGKKIPWDDRLIVKQQLAKLNLEKRK